MRLSPQLKKWLGLAKSPTLMNAQEHKQQKATDAHVLMVNEILLVQAALDEVYGKGYAKNNPIMVAQFMQALATQHLADAFNRHGSKLVIELEAFREIIGSGTGGITVGLEQR